APIAIRVPQTIPARRPPIIHSTEPQNAHAASAIQIPQTIAVDIGMAAPSDAAWSAVIAPSTPNPSARGIWIRQNPTVTTARGIISQVMPSPVKSRRANCRIIQQPVWQAHVLALDARPAPLQGVRLISDIASARLD